MKNMKTLTTLLLSLAFALGAVTPASAQTEKVVLAGGCFWGMQAVFGDLKGVTSAVAGYSGGNAMTAHYEIVSTGATGHAESVEVTYDPSKISFKQLLDVYFLVAHDPTELNRQGPDEGTQYRSEIYYTTAAQQAQAQAYIAKLAGEKVYPAPIVTKVAALAAFYPAENYHQNFVKNNPDNEYVVYNDLPKLQSLRQKYPQLVKN
jgi:peptide-methionine (S)-S-oxide reductase